MASNGVILLNLSNRNAADFQRLEVPDSYEKASGALTAGTYVTVYKWLYQGFMMAPSLCDAVDADDHINLVDRTNGGILEVYPDDTIEIPSEPEPGPEPGPGPGPGPEPEPGEIVHDDPYYRKAVKVYTKTGVAGKIFIENGTTEGDGNSKTFVGDGIEVEISASSLVGYQPGVYSVPGICIIQHGGTSPNGDWYFTSTADMNIYSPTISTPWTYVGPGHSVTQGWPDDGSETDFYYVFEHRNTNPGSTSEVTLTPLVANANGIYDPAKYEVDGFSGVTVSVQSTIEEVVPDYSGLSAGFLGPDGSFQQWTATTNYVEYATLEAGKYLACMGEIAGDRFRLALFPSKSFSDFEPYISEVGASATIIYSAEDPVTVGSASSAVFETTGGVCLIMTSANSQIAKPFLIKIEEE